MVDFLDEKSFRALPENSPFYSVVGRIASAWARMEWSIDMAIWEMANVPHETGACITAQFGGVHSRLRALIALVHLNGLGSFTNELNKFYQDSNEVVLKRNRAVHDAWWVSSPSGTVAQLRLTADKKLDYRFRATSMLEMDEIAAAIKAHDERFTNIWMRLRAARHLASLEKPVGESPSETLG